MCDFQNGFHGDSVGNREGFLSCGPQIPQSIYWMPYPQSVYWKCSFLDQLNQNLRSMRAGIRAFSKFHR